MSDDKEKIEDLENQLKIAKLEKELAEAKQSQKKQNKGENVSDSPIVVTAKIVAKIVLVISGIIVFQMLFPQAFDDKIEFTNPYTGEKYTIPVKNDDILLTYKNLKAFPYNGYLIKFDAAKTSNSTALETAKYCTERKNDGQEDVDKCIYNILYGDSGSTNNSQGDVMLRLFNEYNKDINKAVGRSSEQTEINENQNSSQEYAIGDENFKTLKFQGVNIIYNADVSTEREVKKAATQCYNDGITSEDGLTQCIGTKLKWF